MKKNRGGAKNGSLGKSNQPKPSFVLPPEVPGLAAVMVAVLLFLALLSYSPADQSFINPAGLRGPESHNHLGLAGSYLASILIKFFGFWALWPCLALLLYAWRTLKKSGSDSKILTWAGALTLLFALLALSSMLKPTLAFPWPGHSGGGLFGDFLAQGALSLLGRVGALFFLPILVGLGFLLTLGRPLDRLKTLGCFLAGLQFQEREPEPEKLNAPLQERRARKSSPRIQPELGLTREPTRPENGSPTLAEPPLIVEKTKPPIPKKEAAPKAKEPPRAPGGPYVLPGLELLDDPPPGRPGHASGLSREELMANARLLEEKLRDFGVEGRVVEVSGGPVITMYEYQPAPGVKISKVAGLSDDLTMAMRAISIRVVAPLPGKAAIGIEIPNPQRALVTLKEVIDSPVFQNARSPLNLVLGVDIMGAPVVADLARMPHLLIAGATGSGKSVGLGAMIMSILYKAGPEKVRFLMIDPKHVELALYKDLPHLIYPVLSDPAEATLGLKWAVAEMDARYKLLAEKGVRNIEGYNEKIRAERQTWKRLSQGNPEAKPPEELHLLVIIIDELADLMMVSAKEVEVYITRLAQKARAAGIHLILATQRPSVDVLTGIIKANLPTRISFQVSSKVDSRTILDQMGAEKLLGSGDMLFMPPGVGKLRRLHGAYVSDDEIKRATDFIRAWGPPDYLEDLALPETEGENGDNGEKDPKYDEAVALVRRTQKATISHVQRHLRIGYNRAARIIEDMEREGLIGPSDGVRPRVIF